MGKNHWSLFFLLTYFHCRKQKQKQTKKSKKSKQYSSIKKGNNNTVEGVSYHI